MWTVGYAPYNRVPGAGTFATKREAEAAARRLNTGEFKGRGLKAYRCDAAGRLTR